MAPPRRTWPSSRRPASRRSSAGHLAARTPACCPSRRGTDPAACTTASPGHHSTRPATGRVRWQTHLRPDMRTQLRLCRPDPIPPVPLRYFPRVPGLVSLPFECPPEVPCPARLVPRLDQHGPAYPGLLVGRRHHARLPGRVARFRRPAPNGPHREQPGRGLLTIPFAQPGRARRPSTDPQTSPDSAATDGDPAVSLHPDPATSAPARILPGPPRAPDRSTPLPAIGLRDLTSSLLPFGPAQTPSSPNRSPAFPANYHTPRRVPPVRCGAFRHAGPRP
jgi:hypothetical protein